MVSKSLWRCVVSLVVFLVYGYSCQSPDRVFYNKLNSLIEDVKGNETMSAKFGEHFSQWSHGEPLPQQKDFSCDVTPGQRSSSRPTSVHQLRPGDIDVVGAIGDSLTAAACAKAKSLPSLLFEWRGISWSAGGDKSISDGVVTLPNVIKMYNPNVKGFSTGVNPVKLQDMFGNMKFNVAVSGAKSRDILGQAKKLVEKMKSDKTVDFTNDWKLVTLFIGGNDLCDFCDDENEFFFTKYQQNLRQTLDYLHQNSPRTMVNLVMMLDLTQLSQINDGFVCSILHRIFCKCASFPRSELDRQALIRQTIEYSEAILQLVANGTYDTKEDFTVIAQPFYVNQRLATNEKGLPDLSYFSPDCFHFSAKGHAAAAQAVWNNLVQPAGRKRLSWFPDDRWSCPTQSSPYIFTYLNSDGRDETTPMFHKSLRAGEGLEDKTLLQTEQIFRSNEEGSVVSKFNPATIAMAAVGFLAGVVVVLAALVVMKKSGRREEKTPLLQQ